MIPDIGITTKTIGWTMKLQFYKTNDDGTEIVEKVNYGWFDGYSIGERLLEGVMFRAEVIDNGTDIKITVGKSSERYFSDFNEENWLATAKRFALENDIFCLDEYSGDEVVLLYDFDKSLDDQSANWPYIPTP